jgi:hypothetical protein
MAAQSPLSAGKPKPAYGVDPNDYPPGTEFRTEYYLGGNRDFHNVPEIHEMLIPIGTSLGSWEGVSRSYQVIAPSFTTREDAQKALIEMFRGGLAEKVKSLLEAVTHVQWERGAIADPELDFADDLRKYLKAITP